MGAASERRALMPDAPSPNKRPCRQRKKGPFVWGPHRALSGHVPPAPLGRRLGGRAERARRGGSFITLPALILAGLDPRAANITSTVALFPGQVTTGLAGRSLVGGAQRLSFKALFAISLAGGAFGAIL